MIFINSQFLNFFTHFKKPVRWRLYILQSLFPEGAYLISRFDCFNESQCWWRMCITPSSSLGGAKHIIFMLSHYFENSYSIFFAFKTSVISKKDCMRILRFYFFNRCYAWISVKKTQILLYYWKGLLDSRNLESGYSYSYEYMFLVVCFLKFFMVSKGSEREILIG